MRRTETVRIGLLALALSAFLTSHYLLIEIDFEACFGNYAASVNGVRPHLTVGEMSIGALGQLAIRRLSEDHLFMATANLLPLLPFLIASSVSTNQPSRSLWLSCAFVAVFLIVLYVCTTNLNHFYDCDLNGVGLGILLLPALYLLINVVVVVVAIILLALRTERYAGERD